MPTVNCGTVPCVIAFVLIDARPVEHDGKPPAAHGRKRDTDDTKFLGHDTGEIRCIPRRGGLPLLRIERGIMSQFVGGLLAFFAAFSVFADAPVAVAVFALLTFAWVVFAKPARRGRMIWHVDRWGNVVEAPLGR